MRTVCASTLAHDVASSCHAPGGTRTRHGRMRARKLQRDPGSSRCFDTLRSPTAANALASSCPAIPLPTGRSAGLRDGSKSFMAKHRTPWKPEKTNSSQTLGHMTHSSSGHTGGLRGRPRRGAASESAAAASCRGAAPSQSRTPHEDVPRARWRKLWVCGLAARGGGAGWCRQRAEGLRQVGHGHKKPSHAHRR